MGVGVGTNFTIMIFHQALAQAILDGAGISLPGGKG